MNFYIRTRSSQGLGCICSLPKIEVFKMYISLKFATVISNFFSRYELEKSANMVEELCVKQVWEF